MAAVYIIYSEQLNRFYSGSCQEIAFRLEQHLSKLFKSSFTAKAGDWVLFHLIENLTYKQARSIEAHIKRMNSSVYIRNLKKYPEIMEKLKLKYI